MLDPKREAMVFENTEKLERLRNARVELKDFFISEGDDLAHDERSDIEDNLKSLDGEIFMQMRVLRASLNEYLAGAKL